MLLAVERRLIEVQKIKFRYPITMAITLSINIKVLQLFFYTLNDIALLNLLYYYSL